MGGERDWFIVKTENDQVVQVVSAGMTYQEACTSAAVCRSEVLPSGLSVEVRRKRREERVLHPHL